MPRKKLGVCPVDVFLAQILIDYDARSAAPGPRLPRAGGIADHPAGAGEPRCGIVSVRLCPVGAAPGIYNQLYIQMHSRISSVFHN